MQNAREAKSIGTSFGTELIAAGLGNVSLSWSTNGSIIYAPGTTTEQIAAVEAVYAAHDPFKSMLIEYSAKTRILADTTGITVAGNRYPNDMATRALLMQLRGYLTDNPNETVKWKKIDGTFVELTADQMDAIAKAIVPHSVACSDVEADVLDGINSGAITTTDQIDAAYAGIQRSF